MLFLDSKITNMMLYKRPKTVYEVQLLGNNEWWCDVARVTVITLKLKVYFSSSRVHFQHYFYLLNPYQISTFL